MKQKIYILFSLLLLVSSLYAKDNFSEMSTQELIAIIGYVNSNELQEFKKELENRVTFMSENEKKRYEKSLNKLK